MSEEVKEPTEQEIQKSHVEEAILEIERGNTYDALQILRELKKRMEAK